LKVQAFDTETLRLSDEVTGGFDNPQAMGLSVLALHGVTPAVYIPDERVGEAISEDFQQELLTKEAVMQRFDEADLIVSFNGKHFDVGVLEGAGLDLSVWADKHFDLLATFLATCGHRVSLNNLAKYTLGEEKLLNSEHAVLLWRAGLTLLEDRQERDTVEARITGASHLFRTVIRYCQDDAKKVNDLFWHAARHDGQVRFWDRNERGVRTAPLKIPVFARKGERG